jgi:hypothetical protein
MAKAKQAATEPEATQPEQVQEAGPANDNTATGIDVVLLLQGDMVNVNARLLALTERVDALSALALTAWGKRV